ncbi:uncharacterized protein METZ01_LOCUS307176, partial [marine metagenome]
KKSISNIWQKTHSDTVTTGSARSLTS